MCATADAGMILGITSIVANLMGLGCVEEEVPYVPWLPEDELGSGPMPIPGVNPPVVGFPPVTQPPFDNTPLFPDYATPDSHPGAYLPRV